MGEPMALSNGTWERSSMSIPFILSPQEPAPKPSPKANDHERTSGILTRTIVRTPVVKWILPGRIRDRDKNDVLFVGTSFVELREFSVNNDLRTVAIKTDFDSEIRAACIFGESRKANLGYLDGDDTRHDLDEHGYESMEVDHRGRYELPPQMLALSLQNDNSDRLAFLFAYHDGQQNVRFLSATRPLPTDTQDACRLGAQIAVDPRSRAMAVAAQANRIVIFTLKSRETMKQETKWPTGTEPSNFQPIKQERHLDIHGIVLKMEFLHSPRDREHRNTVILALLIRPFGKTNQSAMYMRYIDWDCSRNLHEVVFDWPQGFPLPNNEQDISLLIPLAISPGVLLACRNKMYIWPNLLSGNLRAEEIPYESQVFHGPASAEPVEPGSSRGLPLCTAWARATRHSAYASLNDTLYLCREDGTVLFYEIDLRGRSAGHYAGNLHANVDTAFACLDLGVGDNMDEIDRGSFDVLIVAGDMSDGGLFEFKAREPKHPRLQRIANWSPTLDYTVVSHPYRREGIGPRASPALHNVTNKDRIFSCADRGARNGTVSEMRFGVEAQTSFEIPNSELDVDGSSATGMWLIPEWQTDPSSQLRAHKFDHAVVCITYPEGTERITISGEGNMINNNSTSYTEQLLDFTHRTILASTTLQEIAVQVTPNSLRAVGMPMNGRDLTPLVEHHFGESHVLQASIDGQDSLCLLSVRTSKGIELQLWQMNRDSDHIQLSSQRTEPGVMSAETSCVHLTTCASEKYALVGTVDGKLFLFACSAQGLSPLYEHQLTGDTAICESICLIRRPRSLDHDPDPVVLCGMRNGTVHVLELANSPSGRRSLRYLEQLDVELETVSVIGEHSSQSTIGELPTRALLISRDCFCRVFYRISKAADLTIQCVWTTHPEHPGARSTSIKSIAQYALWDRTNSAFGKGRMFCMSSDSARLIHLGSEVESVAVPRKMYVDGTPTRISYLSQIKKLAVAFQHVVVPDLESPNGNESRPSDRRMVYPAVQLVDPNSESLSPATPIKDEHSAGVGSPLKKSLPDSCEIVGFSGEKVMGIAEWTPTLNGKTWALLTINTLRVRKHEAQDEGSIYIYRLPSAQGETKIYRQKTIPQERPVSALAPFGQNSLVFCVGTELVVQQLCLEKDGRLKLHSVARHSLRSPARHISVCGNDICVSTTNHSTVLFTLEDEQKLVEKFNDQEGRSAWHNLIIPERSLVLASDLSGAVRGLRKPSHDTLNGSFQPVFEVNLPVSISRMHIASLNPRRGARENRQRQEIIGSSFDGSFYSFSFLDLDEWRLLMLIQNMARKSRSISPFSAESYKDVSLEPKQTLRGMHIDGDVLARIFATEDGQAVEFLRDLVATSHSDEYEYGSVADGQLKFTNLAGAVSKVEKNRDLYEATVDYLRGILQIDT